MISIECTGWEYKSEGIQIAFATGSAEIKFKYAVNIQIVICRAGIG